MGEMSFRFNEYRARGFFFFYFGGVPGAYRLFAHLFKPMNTFIDNLDVGILE